jgi:uncharacterized protein YndB with AHSA1/START domain
LSLESNEGDGNEEWVVSQSSEQPAPVGYYLREVTCHAPRERVFAAVSTVGGLRGWWTPIVTGTTQAGGQLWFGFEGSDELIAMRVDELTDLFQVRWTCLEHTGARDWAGTTIRFELRDGGPQECVLNFEHVGLPADDVTAGWDRFLTSLTRFVDTGQGAPYRAGDVDALTVARAYHTAWTGGDFDTARSYLAADLKTEVPMNIYTGRDDFAAAVANFGALAERVDLLAEFSSGEQALLLYDMHTQPFGQFRIAEQFTVHDGLIRRIRHVHDTAALRGAA